MLPSVSPLKTAMTTMLDPTQPFGFATRAIHLAYDPHDYHGALIPPVFMTATYAFEDITQSHRPLPRAEPG